MEEEHTMLRIKTIDYMIAIPHDGRCIFQHDKRLMSGALRSIGQPLLFFNGQEYRMIKGLRDG